MSRSLDSFHVGDVMLAGSFTVSPADAVGHFRARVMNDVVGNPAESGSQLSMGPVPGAVAPTRLVVASALTALRAFVGRSGLELVVHQVGPVAKLRKPVIGEPLTCVATVRYRSRDRETGTFLTLGVELRGRTGGTAVRFEVGVELVEKNVSVEIDDEAVLFAVA